MIASYTVAGSQEYCVIRSADADVRICLIPPLFDETNRMRRTLIEVMRLLAKDNVGSILPDLPGCNESLADLSNMGFAQWRLAMRAVCKQHRATHSAAFRGGILLDDTLSLPRWRLAPVKGANLLRTMLRTKIASAKEDSISHTMDALMDEGRTNGLELAGNTLSSAMLTDLDSAVPDDGPDIRSVTIGNGEQQIAGSALWLRAEPDYDSDMARSITADLLKWSE